MEDRDDKTKSDEAASSTAIHDPMAVFTPAIQDAALAPALAIQAKEDREKKRPKVTVMNGSPTPLILQLYALPNEEEAKGLPPDVTIGYRQELASGANQGIDKGFFDFWKNQNKHLSVVANGMITAQDEPFEDEQDKASAESESSDKSKKE